VIHLSRTLKNKNKGLAHIIAHNNPKSPITEQYRLIRNNINFSSVDKKIRSIVVTSPEPSEGKTTTAANLSIVLSQQGKKVILVEGDLRKPSVHHMFNASNLDGITTVLTKEINLDMAIIETQVPNLDILTSGPIPPNPSELLDSIAMEKVMDELNDRYEYVVFDTPPTLSVIDSQVLANKCDGVVLVVASGKTQRDQLVKAKDLLDKAKSHLLGVVVNGVKVKKSGYYGDYS